MVTNCDLEEAESSKSPLFAGLSKVTTCDLERANVASHISPLNQCNCMITRRFVAEEFYGPYNALQLGWLGSVIRLITGCYKADWKLQLSLFLFYSTLSLSIKKS